MRRDREPLARDAAERPRVVAQRVPHVDPPKPARSEAPKAPRDEQIAARLVERQIALLERHGVRVPATAHRALIADLIAFMHEGAKA